MHCIDASCGKRTLRRDSNAVETPGWPKCIWPRKFACWNYISTQFYGQWILSFAQTGRTALHLAAAKGQTGAVRCLLSTGTVTINAADKVYIQLHRVYVSVITTNCNYIQRARSALFYAAENGHLRTVRELLGRRAALGQMDEVYWHTVVTLKQWIICFILTLF